MRKYSRYEWFSGGITSPQGFTASGISAGIKAGKKDMALIVSECPAAAAGMFTLNKVKAAPVILCQNRLERHNRIKAVIINSGNANACTGKEGLADAESTAAIAAGLVKTTPSSVLVCSTGTIGIRLPMEKIRRGLKLAVENLAQNGGVDAARAIMTTDTCAKQAAVRVRIDKKNITIGAMAKGAGMIAPNMATLLVFITTDAAIKQSALKKALSSAVEMSFNRISVDGDQSTNDTVICLAGGAAGNFPLTENNAEWPIFKDALTAVCQKLAAMIVKDGEGVTKVIALSVKGARKPSDAEKVARSIARSLLVKTSWFGADPNWGRIMCAIGYSGAEIVPDKISIHYNNKAAVIKGRSSGLPPEKLREIIAGKEFMIEVNLHQGASDYSMLTCDCSIDYVKINADYMT